MSTPTVSLRERKKERVREQLMEAAFRLFTRRGFENVTIDDVVEAVEVSRRTFFRYFDSKEDVVIAWFEGFGEDMRAALRERPKGEKPFIAIERVLVDAVGRYQEDHDRSIALERLITSSPDIRARKEAQHARWAKGMADVMAERLGMDAQKDLLPRLVTNVALGVLCASVERWRAGGGKGNVSAMVKDGFALVRKEMARGRK